MPLLFSHYNVKCRGISRYCITKDKNQFLACSPVYNRRTLHINTWVSGTDLLGLCYLVGWAWCFQVWGLCKWYHWSGGDLRPRWSPQGRSYTENTFMMTLQSYTIVKLKMYRSKFYSIITLWVLTKQCPPWRFLPSLAAWIVPLLITKHSRIDLVFLTLTTFWRLITSHLS